MRDTKLAGFWMRDTKLAGVLVTIVALFEVIK